MSRKKKSLPESELKKREAELFKLQYENEDEVKIEQYSKYHFRVFYKNDCIDVWVVSKKYYARWFTESKTYKSINEILKAFQTRPKVKMS